MRILITTLIFLVAILNPAVAEDTWGRGDKVSVFYMCREEKDIMDIALADSESVAKYITVLNTKQLDGACSRIVPPVLLNVRSVVSQYKDHKEKNTTILKLLRSCYKLKSWLHNKQKAYQEVIEKHHN